MTRYGAMIEIAPLKAPIAPYKDILEFRGEEEINTTVTNKHRLYTFQLFTATEPVDTAPSGEVTLTDKAPTDVASVQNAATGGTAAVNVASDFRLTV